MAAAGRRGNGEGSTPRQRADGRWQVEFRHVDEYGVMRRNYCYGKTQAEVRAKAKEMKARLVSGRPAKDAKITLASFTATWISSSLAASERRPSTKSLIRGLANKRIAGSKLGSLPLDRVKPTSIEGWLVDLRGANLAEATVLKCFQILKMILDDAARDGLMASNPALAVRRPKVTHYEASFLTPSQVGVLLDNATESRFAPVFEFLIGTGLRRGEALALGWDDLDFERSLIRVTGSLSRVEGHLIVTQTKTAKSKRFLHMSEDVTRLLRRVRANQREERLKAGSAWVETGLVFTTAEGTAIEPRNALRALKVAAKKAGLPPSVGLHTLRHSAASTMLTNGVPLTTVSEILGHGSAVITASTYSHVAPSVAAAALNALGAALAKGKAVSG